MDVRLEKQVVLAILKKLTKDKRSVPELKDIDAIYNSIEREMGKKLIYNRNTVRKWLGQITRFQGMSRFWMHPILKVRLGNKVYYYKEHRIPIQYFSSH